MRRVVVLRTALAVLLAATLLSGCLAPTPAHLQRWQDEARQQGAMGLAAEFDLAGHPYHITGEGEIPTLSTPVWIVPSVPGWTGTAPYVYLATTLDGAGPGVLRLDGSQVRATTGTLAGLHVERVEGRAKSLHLTPAEDPLHDKPTIAWRDSQFNASSDMFHARSVPVTGTGLRLDSFERGTFYAMDGTTRNVEAPVMVDITAMYLLPLSLVVMQEGTFPVHYDSFAWAADATDGTLTTEKGVGLPRPIAVMGNNATLTIQPGRVASQGPFRLTQAVGPNGPLLNADVEVQGPESPVVEVGAGNTTWVRYDYRERSYEGAAVSTGVNVTGPGKDLVTVRMERPPTFLEEMFALVQATPAWASPIVGLMVALSLPGLVWVEIFTEIVCVIGTCPERHPYPTWMEPGQIGTFYVEVRGHTEPGTYPVEIRLSGANHSDLVLPLEIHVVPQGPTPAPSP